MCGRQGVHSGIPQLRSPIGLQGPCEGVLPMLVSTLLLWLWSNPTGLCPPASRLPLPMCKNVRWQKLPITGFHISTAHAVKSPYGPHGLNTLHRACAVSQKQCLRNSKIENQAVHYKHTWLWTSYEHRDQWNTCWTFAYWIFSTMHQRKDRTLLLRLSQFI